jgi:branched-chain amino acid aminotransferase
MSKFISYNNELYDENTDMIGAFSRAVHYGDGVFETMRSRGDRVFRLTDHLDRMCSGLNLLHIPLPDVQQLKTATAEVLRANALPEATLKIIAFRSGPPGPTPPATHKPCILIIAKELDRDTLCRNAGGVSARIVGIRRNTTSPLCGIKSLNYLDNICARLEARDNNALEALFLNQHGFVAEGATSNVFTVQDGVLRTPPVSAGALPGITRRVLFEIACSLSLPCSEADISLDELKAADELFLTNAGSGVMPLTMLDGEPVGSGTAGPLTLRCQIAYNEIFTRETEHMP